VAYARLDDTIICTFGDMMRVPGSSSSLELEKARGADVRIVYSPLDAVELSQKHTGKNVIFLGVGFETTAPTVAAAVATAEKLGISNFYLSIAHKTMPRALAALVADEAISLSGFILPAHVSTIIGVAPYRFLSERYAQACVITGFEPLDVLLGILMLVKQLRDSALRVEIQYKRAVRAEGNPKALELLERVFEPCDAEWRGLGIIPDSGLTLKKNYLRFNAESQFEVPVEKTVENKKCICGDILRGAKTPKECSLFGKICTPENPIGACMVSSEGTCAAYYKYRTI
jgi:hydrogenase expression/formation protein HypD